MDRTQKTVIMLLKSAITGQTQALPGDYDLSLVCKVAQKHQIVPMLYQGAVNCGIDTQLPEMQKMFQLYCRAIQHSEGQLAWVQKIYDAFDRAGVDYMPLKGCVLKPLYPKPELRTMGDADILIRVEQYDKIAPLLTALGFQDRGESDHELKWWAPGLNLELHKRLIPSYNQDYYAYYGNGWQLAKEQSGSRYAMTKEDAFVYTFAHFAKHFRGGGAGYRYVADLYVYLREYPDMDFVYIREEMKKLNMDRFYEHIMALLECWFGSGAADETLEAISQYIYREGVWGDVASKALSKTLRASGGAALRKNSRWFYLKKLLFPGVQEMQYRYPVLKKAPWLLPGTWILRGGRILFRERSKMDVKQKEFQAVETTALQERQAFLEQVGLPYSS